MLPTDSLGTEFGDLHQGTTEGQALRPLCFCKEGVGLADGREAAGWGHLGCPWASAGAEWGRATVLGSMSRALPRFTTPKCRTGFRWAEAVTLGTQLAS